MSNKVVSGKPSALQVFDGWVPSRKSPDAQAGLIAFPNLLSRDALCLLEAEAEVAEYTLDPVIVWKHRGSPQQAIFTFAAQTRQSGRILIDVRRTDSKSSTEKKHRDEQMAPQLPSMGVTEIIVWDEVKIRVQPRLENAVALVFEGGDPSEAQRFAIRSALRLAGGQATIGALRQLSGLADQARPTLFALMREGEIVQIDTCVLNNAAMVTFAGRLS